MIQSSDDSMIQLPIALGLPGAVDYLSTQFHTHAPDRIFELDSPLIL